MTVSFYNAAGTDLDSLFYTDNSNAGAVGFLEPARGRIWGIGTPPRRLWAMRLAS